jgi:putative iron-only hydrogenase system regulator
MPGQKAVFCILYQHDLRDGGTRPEELQAAVSDPEGSLMEKRIGVIAILVTDPFAVSRLNDLLHEYGSIVLGRQGLPLRDKRINVISLIVEGSTDEIGALTGKAGKLSGVRVKSVLTAYREEGDDEDPGGGR